MDRKYPKPSHRLKSDVPGHCTLCLHRKSEYFYIPYGHTDARKAYFCTTCDFTPGKLEPGTFPDNQEV